jgi:hypothetical protein
VIADLRGRHPKAVLIFFVGSARTIVRTCGLDEHWVGSSWFNQLCRSHGSLTVLSINRSQKTIGNYLENKQKFHLSTVGLITINDGGKNNYLGLLNVAILGC